MPGSSVPRNSGWSWTRLVAEYGEEHALLLLMDMPGLGEYEETSRVNEPGVERSPYVLPEIVPTILRRLDYMLRAEVNRYSAAAIWDREPTDHERPARR